MAPSKHPDQHRLDHAPHDYLEDPRGSGAGAYTGQGDQKQPGPGNYGEAAAKITSRPLAELNRRTSKHDSRHRSTAPEMRR